MWWSARTEGNKVLMDGKSETTEMSGSIADKKLTAEIKGSASGKFNLTYSLRHSPTEGDAPPPGAVVLLPYAEGKVTSTAEWTNATWKAPLREFLSGLSQAVDAVYEELVPGLGVDPWALRDDYEQVLINHTTPNDFVHEHANSNLSANQVTLLKNLLAAQHERLRMLSSDAWFFYDLDRIEPLNALKYAAHATYLTELACGKNVSQELLPMLGNAKSQHSGLTGDMAFMGYYSRFELSYA